MLLENDLILTEESIFKFQNKQSKIWLKVSALDQKVNNIKITATVNFFQAKQQIYKNMQKIKDDRITSRQYGQQYVYEQVFQRCDLINNSSINRTSDNKSILWIKLYLQQYFKYRQKSPMYDAQLFDLFDQFIRNYKNKSINNKQSQTSKQSCVSNKQSQQINQTQSLTKQNQTKLSYLPKKFQQQIIQSHLNQINQYHKCSTFLFTNKCYMRKVYKKASFVNRILHQQIQQKIQQIVANYNDKKCKVQANTEVFSELKQQQSVNQINLIDSNKEQDAALDNRKAIHINKFLLIKINPKQLKYDNCVFKQQFILVLPRRLNPQQRIVSQIQINGNRIKQKQQKLQSIFFNNQLIP